MGLIQVGQTIASNPTVWRNIGSGSNQLQVQSGGWFYVPESQSGTLTHLHAKVRRAGQNNGKVRLALYRVNDAGEPTDLLASTGLITVSSAGGQVITGSVTQNNVRLLPGDAYALGIWIDEGTVGVDVNSAVGSGVVYQRTVGSGGPTTPMGFTSIATSDALGLWMSLDENFAPSVVPTSPINAPYISTITPTFVAQVTDPNALYGDGLSAYVIEVRQSGQAALIWDSTNASFIASATEQASGTISRVYSGPALTRDVPYQWRVWAYDKFGAPSVPTSWHTFTASPGGTVILDNALPRGKIENGSPSLWSAKWLHASGLSMTHVQIRLLDRATRQQVKISPEISVGTVISNTNWSINHSSTGFGVLEPGLYTWQAIGKDTAGAWGGWGTTSLDLTVNAPPNVPGDLTPPSGSVVAAPLRLEWVLVDPDIDDVVGVDVVADIEFTRPNQTTFTRTGITNVDPVSGRMFYQTTLTDLPNGVYGEYGWRVIGRDVSANQSSLAWSTPSIFIYAPVPVITVSSPGITVSTSTPIFNFSVQFGPMVSFRVDLYRFGETSPFFSSGQKPVTGDGVTEQYQIPGGWLGNGSKYMYAITVWSASNTTATYMSTSPFTVSYPSSSMVQGVQGSLRQKANDVEPSVVFVGWAQSLLPPARFAGYVIYRRFAYEDFPEAVPVALVTSINRLAWSDHFAPVNEPLIYSVVQLERVGSDIRASAPNDILIEVPLTVPTLTSVTDPEGLHIPLTWINTDVSNTFERPETVYQVWGGLGKPVVVTTPPSYGKNMWTVGFKLRTDERQTREEAWREYIKIRNSGHIFCLRFEHERGFVRIQKNSVKRSSSIGVQDVQLGFEEVAHQEAVKIPV